MLSSRLMPLVTIAASRFASFSPFALPTAAKARRIAAAILLSSYAAIRPSRFLMVSGMFSPSTLLLKKGRHLRAVPSGDWQARPKRLAANASYLKICVVVACSAAFCAARISS